MKISSIVLIVVFTLSGFNVNANFNITKDSLTLYSTSCALIDGDSGRVLYEKNGNEKRPMASTTKIMTLIIALEYGDINSIANVSEYASKMPEVKLGVKTGEQYYLKDLLYSLMLESHNDSAVVIAENIAGSVDGFSDLMNKKAKELNLINTYFITPNGLDEEDENGIHSTTAIELARLLRYCVYESPQKDLFVEICRTKLYSFSDVENKRNFTVNNKNSYLDMRDGVICGKTGFTCDAGYCYCCSLESEGRKYIIALLGCGWPGNKTYKWKDADKLFDYALANYHYKEIDLTEYSTKLNVTNSINDNKVNLVCNEKLSILLNEEDVVNIEKIIPDSVEAPIDIGDKIGEIQVFVNDDLYCVYDLLAENFVAKYTYKYCLENVINSFIY